MRKESVFLSTRIMTYLYDNFTLRRDGFELMIGVYEDDVTCLFYEEAGVKTFKGNKWDVGFNRAYAEELKALLIDKHVIVFGKNKTMKLLKRLYKEAGYDTAWFSLLDFEIDDGDYDEICREDHYYFP